jgi:hypothetical protein
MHRQKVTKQTKSRRTPNHQNLSMELGAWSRGPDRTTETLVSRLRFGCRGNLSPSRICGTPVQVWSPRRPIFTAFRFKLHPLPPALSHRSPLSFCALHSAFITSPPLKFQVWSPRRPIFTALRFKPHTSPPSLSPRRLTEKPPHRNTGFPTAPRSLLPAPRFGRHGDPSPSRTCGTPVQVSSFKLHPSLSASPLPAFSPSFYVGNSR